MCGMTPQGWHRGTPPWWPANESWPPRYRHHWRSRRRFFAFKAFAVFGVLFVLSVYGAVTLLRSLVGGTAFPSTSQFVWLIVLFIGFVLALTMRRVGRPLGDVVSAAEQVAAGDFGVRLREHGPPWLRSVAAAFNSMTTRLQAQRQQRQELMADIAHELRTPLAVMQGRLEGMLDGVYARDERQLERVLEETRTLARLVDDLRTLAHSEGGTLTLSKEPTDLGVLLDETVTAFQPEAEAHGVTVRMEAASDLPLVEIDPLRIREVLMNLLSNAVRYSPKGSSAWIAAESRSNTVVIQVKDNGPGITADELAHVFDRFYKGSASSGSGLGLTIARNLVVAHGGTLTADSEQGRGTTMIMTFPIQGTV